MDFINNLATRSKLTLLTAIALISLIIIGLVGILKLSDVNKGLETVYNDRVVPLDQLKRIADAYAVDIVDTTHKTRNGNISFNDCAKNIHEAKSIVDKNWKAYMATSLTPEEATLAKDAEALMVIGNQMGDHILKACDAKDAALIANISATELYPMIDPIGEKISALMELQIRVAKEEKEKAAEIYQTSRTLIIAIIVSAFLLIVILSILIIKDITGKLEKVKAGLLAFFRFLSRETSKAEAINLESEDEFGQMVQVINENIVIVEKGLAADSAAVANAVQVANKVKAGHLNEQINVVPNNPQLAELRNVLNEMLLGLNGNVEKALHVLKVYASNDFTPRADKASLQGEVASLIDGVNNLGNEISTMLASSLQNGIDLQGDANSLKQAVESLSTASNQQAASLEETAAAMEEMTSNVQNNAQKSNEMASMAAQTDVSAKEGAELANRTAAAMTEIQAATNSINDAVAIIENIAFQTNILSLNAAVEAATAGDAGKGFAVVAQEVRNLANRSADAAKEIKTLAAQAARKSNEGMSIANELTRGFEVIADKIEQTTMMVQDVSNASREQMQGIGQINTAVTQLDQMTQENAKIAAEADSIANATIDKATAMVADASSKNFVGKSAIHATQPVKNVVARAHKPVHTMPVRAAHTAVSSIKKPMPTPTKPSKHDGDVWESF
jgi:methyl-accepting chemotaxis protein